MPTVLVTAGPTREHLDDVRFLSNASSGRMGYAIAAAARAAGCEVLLVTGPSPLAPPPGVEVVAVVSALEMLTQCRAAFPRCDLFFAVAAVADHRPAARAPGKPAKTDGPQVIELVPNPDIVATLAAEKGNRFVVGFSLDSASASPEEQLARARAKLARKRLDLIVVNDARALGAATSEARVVDARGTEVDVPAGSKAAVGEWLVREALRRWQGHAA